MGALSGCRILDLAGRVSRLAVNMLTEMGAEVTSLELRGVPYSTAEPVCSRTDFSLDLGEGGGEGRFRGLVREADVLIEATAPGYLARKGLDYACLKETNPRLIMVSLTPFGQDGVYRDYLAAELTLEAIGGWMSVTGLPDAPLKLYGEQAYHTASLFAVNGILLALMDREVTGCGQHLDISIMECVAATLDHVLVRYFYDGVVSSRRGSRHWNNASAVLPAADGFILVSIHQNWETLVEWLASEGM
ncbi:MAG: CoA transferase, partial [Dehalococcoidales bacterium]|nr:CoA transferase [Dehalococcoidales bacterium]